MDKGVEAFLISFCQSIRLNHWESETPEEFSGLGTEFLMETLEETEWAIDVMHTLMAYNL